MTIPRKLMINNHLIGNNQLTKEQIIYALSLGDGSLSLLSNKGTCGISIYHCEDQLLYLKYKENVLNSIGIETNLKKYHRYLKSTDKTYISYKLTGKSCKEIGNVNKVLYVKTGYKRHKKVIRDFSLFTDYALYLFTLDDFTRYGKQIPKNWGSFCTEDFSYSENIILQEYLKLQFGIPTVIHKRKLKYRLYVPSMSLVILKDVLAKYNYLNSCMDYKLS